MSHICWVSGAPPSGRPPEPPPPPTQPPPTPPPLPDSGRKVGGWLSKALGPKGPLAGFRAPYRLGDPTNVVWQVGRPSERELDWILLGPETPCVGAEKVLLPGLSTHRMVQCDLGFAERVFAAADPSCRRFCWSQLRPEQQAPAAAAASLALWWSAHARLAPDGAVQAAWANLEGLVPS